MSLIKFLTSKTFAKQLGLAILAVVVLCFLMLKWLKFSTNHGEFIEVPQLQGKTLDVAQIELEDNDLQIVVQDSANYNPNYPRFSVIEQLPEAGSLVKEDRKIYLTLNPSGYKKVAVPKIIRRTIRQARPTLEALEFEIGNITYIDDIGKNEVLAIKHKGKTITPGTMLPKTSKIDLVLGNGKRPSN
ncbi:MAG: PASTA domain-containing protein [Bacteroidia bacterium]|nr:PASTA domain-containing protein [Bacteroidia bacterium]NND26108.1 PASTA domain-containing protein [Flavobacteriaceae bacterium]MBT8278302.1 PASTA domain-containing protein [Bacteroidia bacterium]NNK60049.1 PASTA domain-containing protein [Flavobacteriaceae bacterium]NNL32714.1 PASTA domain-containing protein [Flavobacteriaceae bacterium]